MSGSTVRRLSFQARSLTVEQSNNYGVALKAFVAYHHRASPMQLNSRDFWPMEYFLCYPNNGNDIAYCAIPYRTFETFVVPTTDSAHQAVVTLFGFDV